MIQDAEVLFLNAPWIFFMSLDLITERLKHKQSTCTLQGSLKK